MSRLVFLKLGGSLITDKSREQSLRQETLTRLANEIADGLAHDASLRLIIGHGSGSFGHTEAKKYGTRQGVTTPAGWRGYADVAQVAARLNRHVFDSLRAAGVPVVNVPPSASAVCRDGVITRMELAPITTALEHRLVPLVMGDVAIDEVRGGTIVSTEDVFFHLAKILEPSEILLSGIERGVLTHLPDGDVIPLIDSGNIDRIRAVLRGSAATDVTGGMESKVLEMLRLAKEVPGLRVVIFPGTEENAVRQLLLHQAQLGTVVTG